MDAAVGDFVRGDVHVRDGAIVGETTPETRLAENSFLIWKDEVEDFELRLKDAVDGLAEKQDLERQAQERF